MVYSVLPRTSGLGIQIMNKNYLKGVEAEMLR